METPNASPEKVQQPDKDARTHRARVLVEMGRPREALPLLQQWTDEEPESDEAWSLASHAFHHLKDGERGVKAADLSIQANPYGTEGHIWKCRNLLVQQFTGDGVRAAREGLELTHGDPAVRLVVVEALLADNKIDEALSELNILVPQLPGNADVSWLQAETLRRRGYYDYAVPHYEYALQRDPDNAAAWAGLGALRKEQRHIQPAITCWYHACRSDPLNSEYRTEFVNLVDGLMDQRFEITVIQALLLFGLLGGGLILYTWHPLLPIPVVAAGAYWGFRAIGLDALRTALKPQIPQVFDYYRRVKPQARRETYSACGWLLVVLLILAGLIWGGIELTRRGLWLTALRIGLVTVVVGPWLWARLAPDRPPKGEQPPVFYFPGEDRPEGTAVYLPAQEEDPLDSAWRFLHEKKPEASLQITRRLLAVEPENARALTVHAQGQAAMGQWEEAIQTAKQAAALEPETAAYRVLVWIMLTLADRLGEVEAEAADAPEVLDGMDKSLHTYVDALAAGAVPGVRKKVALMLRSIAPGSVFTHAISAEWACEEGRWTDAERDYRAALALAPLHGAYTCNLGTALELQKRRREGWELYNHALRVDPTCTAAANNLEGIAVRCQIWTSLIASLCLGVLGMWPTILGSSKNAWMPWITFAGPFAVAALAAGVGRVAMHRFAPALREADTTHRGALYWGPLIGYPVLLTFHAFQAWLEIGRNPALLAPRWEGAATIAFLAACADVWVYNTFIGPWRASLRARSPKKPEQEGTSLQNDEGGE